MSRWHDEFEKHSVHSKIESIHELLNDSSFRKLDSEAEQEISRFKKVMELIETIFSNTDHEVTSKILLDQISAPLNSAIGQLNNFKSNSNQQLLQSANEQLDIVLGHLATITAIASSHNSVGDISVNTMIKRGEDYLVTLDEKRKEAQKQIAGLNESSSQLETKVTELQTLVANKITELNQLSSNWTKQFNDSQTDKEDRFKTELKTIEQTATTKTDEIIDTLSSAVSEKQETYELEIDDILGDAGTRHKDIKKLHGLVANDSITGGYKKTADDEANSANYWRKGSIFFALLAVGWLGFVFLQAGGINWKASLSAIPITFILLSLAGYAGHQSSLHRQQANRQRQFALEMLAIDPYLENMGKEERMEIKVELAKKYFGQIPDPQKQSLPKNPVIFPGSLIEQIIRLIKKSSS